MRPIRQSPSAAGHGCSSYCHPLMIVYCSFPHPRSQGTCGLVAMTSASHAEGRQFDPGQVYDRLCLARALFLLRSARWLRATNARRTPGAEPSDSFRRTVALSRMSVKGTWCSGITSASHAEGPGFKSQCVHFMPRPEETLRAPPLLGQQSMTLAGLEPAIFGSEDQRLIH